MSSRERDELPVRIEEKYAELDGISTPPDQRETPEVEIADEAWGEHTSGPSDRVYSGDDDRSSDFSDQHGQTLQEQLIEQLELAKLSAPSTLPSRASSPMPSPMTAI